MPKMKNGELQLTPKDQNFYKCLLADPKQNATAAAIKAGYSAKTAATAGSKKLKRAFYRGYPPEAR